MSPRVVVALLTVVSMAPAAPAGAQDGGPDNPPLILGAHISPGSLPIEGGTLTISVEAIDDYGIAMAYADVIARGMTVDVVQLIPSAIDPSGVITFSGVTNVPPNTTDGPIDYGVTITVTDTNGAFDTENAGVVTVPPGIATGLLKLSHTSRSFGTVKVGKQHRESFSLRNTGKKGTPPVTGYLTVFGSPFSLVGATSVHPQFSLRPGESRTYQVEFRPTTPGPQSGSVFVTRDNGQQSGLSLLLSGIGVARK